MPWQSGVLLWHIQLLLLWVKKKSDNLMISLISGHSFDSYGWWGRQMASWFWRRKVQ